MAKKKPKARLVVEMDDERRISVDGYGFEHLNARNMQEDIPSAIIHARHLRLVKMRSEETKRKFAQNVEHVEKEEERTSG